MNPAPNLLDRIVELEKANGDERYEAGMYKCLYEAWEKRALNAENQISLMAVALQFAIDGYSNPDVSHVDYRVKVYQVALLAMSKLPPVKETNHD